MIETMEEIMHLERVTVGAGALTIESVEDMRGCAGGRTSQADAAVLDIYNRIQYIPAA
jgi:hypothetical protein